MAKDTIRFEETKARMSQAGWGPRGIRLLFNNEIVDEYNRSLISLSEAKRHFPAIEKHPLFNRS